MTNKQYCDENGITFFPNCKLRDLLRNFKYAVADDCEIDYKREVIFLLIDTKMDKTFTAKSCPFLIFINYEQN